MAVSLKPNVKTMKVVQLLNRATESQWATTDPVLMAGMMCYATDSGVVKIGDGVKKWSETPVFYSKQLVDAVQTYRYVANIAARDALSTDKKGGLVIVIDATADATVSSDKKQAGYVWNADANSGAGGWDKIFEQESMDVDLSGFFDMAKNTADDIRDGSTKVVMTKAERVALADVVSDAVRWSDAIIVEGVDAAGLAAYYAE